MTRRTQRALSAAAAGACLMLCACGSASSPGASGSQSAPTRSGSAAGSISPTASHFCHQASTFMGKIPPVPSGHITLTEARANMKKVLRHTVHGFSELRADGPHSLRHPLNKIIRVYKTDEDSLNSAGSISQLTSAMTKHNVKAAASFEQVLKYIAAHCR